MQPRSFTDFLFAGVATVPFVLIQFDQAGMAIMAFVPLLIAACLCSWHEQPKDGKPPN